MSSSTVIGVVVAGVVLVIAATWITLSAARGGRRPSPPAGTVVEERAGLTRREVVNRGIIGAFVAALSGVAASAVTYAWPEATGQGGARYVVGGVSDIRRRLAADRRPYVGGNGRFYLVPFPTSRLEEARKIYPAPVLSGMELGLVALSPVCTHLGCHVPYCASSAWFECPCHGSRYDGIGEQRRGPAPRGLDHYAVSVAAGLVTVDTTRTYPGPASGAETTDDPAAGPHCF